MSVRLRVRTIVSDYRLVFGLLLIVACSRGHGEEEAPSTKADVGTATVALHDFTETVQAIGTVTPRPGHIASLTAPIAARVTQVLVTTGQHVSTGQTLVQLDQAAVQASKQSAEATLTAAERASERVQRLVSEGIVARKDAEQAAAELARARADVVQARLAADRSTVRAPFSGVVTRVAAVLGQTTDPNQPLVEVVDLGALDIVLNMSPSDAARVRPGVPVTLTAGENAVGAILGTGSVIDISGVLDSVSRTVAVRARIAGARPLRVGETVFGKIAVTTVRNAIVIPGVALVPAEDGFKVFVVDASGRVHSRPVEVGARTDSMARIVKGLAVGERIVTQGAYGVEDSTQVVTVHPPAARQANP